MLKFFFIDFSIVFYFFLCLYFFALLQSFVKYCLLHFYSIEEVAKETKENKEDLKFMFMSLF